VKILLTFHISLLQQQQLVECTFEAGHLQQSNHLEKHRENRLLLGVRSAWEKSSSNLPQAMLETHLPCSTAAGCRPGNLPGQILT